MHAETHKFLSQVARNANGALLVGIVHLLNQYGLSDDLLTPAMRAMLSGNLSITTKFELVAGVLLVREALQAVTERVGREVGGDDTQDLILELLADLR